MLGKMSETEPSPRDDLRSRTVEFMLVGGATLVLLPLAWLLRKAVGLDSSELAVGMLTFYAAYVINDPHFAVTYLLFYKDIRNRALSTTFSRAQRARYVVAGLVVPLALAGWAAVALKLHSAQALGWMIQLMFLLVGWHYAKQGFGVLTVLSARRGARLTPRERTTILFHCYAAWAFAWANPASRAGEFEEKGVVYWAPAHPRWLELVTGAVLAAEHRRPRRGARREVATRSPDAPDRAARRSPRHRVVVDDLLERRPAPPLRDPGAPLRAVLLLRVADEAQRGARARGAAFVRTARGRSPRAPRRSRRSASDSSSSAACPTFSTARSSRVSRAAPCPTPSARRRTSRPSS